MTLFGSSGSSSNNNSSSISSCQASRVPPGFRFHPTDEELVGYYLQKKVASKKIDLDVIHEIDLYKLEPWDLHERCKIGSAEQTEWYFFSHKDKKYPTGTRTNRATAAGFWKATGRDKAIHAKFKLIGMRKTLVFYKGRAPNGQKSDWIMHEYRLEDEHASNSNDDGWVVCRVFKKRSSHKLLDRDGTCCYDDQIALLPELESPGGDLPVYNHSLVNCKQEFDPEVYIPLHHDSFSQLPRLESPRLSSQMPPPSTTSSSTNSLIKGFLQQSQFGMREFTLPPAFEVAAPPGERSTLFGQHHLKLPSFSNEPVTDWRMVDRLAAAQLSNEGETSKARYLAAAAGTTNSDLPSAEDVELLCRLSKPHASTSPSSEFTSSNPPDGDLWSFGR